MHLPNFPLAVRFASAVLLGAVAYILTLVLFHRERVSVFWNVAKMIRNPVQGKKPIDATPSI